jgi:hypothetical protein
MFTWCLNFQIQINGFLSPYLQKNMLAPEKKGLASELFSVLSTPAYGSNRPNGRFQHAQENNRPLIRSLYEYTVNMTAIDPTYT